MQLRTEYDELLAAYQSLIAANSAAADGLASLMDEFPIRYTYEGPHGSINAAFRSTWGDLLKIVRPDLFGPKMPVSIRDNIRRCLSDNTKRDRITLNEMDVDTVKYNLWRSDYCKSE